MSAIESLQTALAAEHAAVYVYGVLGAQTSQGATPVLFGALEDGYTTHRARRDEVAGMLRDLGATPTAAAPAYQVPTDLSSPDRVTRAALDIETAAARTYRYVVASTGTPTRRWAITALTDAAVRGLSLGGRPTQLPGGPS